MAELHPIFRRHEDYVAVRPFSGKGRQFKPGDTIDRKHVSQMVRKHWVSLRRIGPPDSRWTKQQIVRFKKIQAIEDELQAELQAKRDTEAELQAEKDALEAERDEIQAKLQAERDAAAQTEPETAPETSQDDDAPRAKPLTRKQKKAADKAAKAAKAATTNDAGNAEAEIQEDDVEPVLEDLDSPPD